MALGKSWCLDHFNCANGQCRKSLQETGFVEEQGQLYCETCFEQYLAPICSKCNSRIKGVSEREDLGDKSDRTAAGLSAGAGATVASPVLRVQLL